MSQNTEDRLTPNTSVMPSKSIASRLRLAFAGVAGATFISSLAAIWAFSEVEDTFTTVTQRSFPVSEASSSLKALSEELQTVLISLIDSATQDAFEANQDKVQSVMIALQNEVSVLDALNLSDSKNLKGQLSDLDASISQTSAIIALELDLESRMRTHLKSAGLIHERFLSHMGPVVTDANADVLAAARRVSASSGSAVHGLVDTEFFRVSNFFAARMEAHRLFSSLNLTKDLNRELETQISIRELDRLLNFLPAELQTPGRALIEEAERALEPTSSIFQLNIVAEALKAFDRSLNPVVLSATFDLVRKSDDITLDSTNQIVELVSEQVNALARVQEFIGNVNLLVSQMAQLVSSQSATELANIRLAVSNNIDTLSEIHKEIQTSTSLEFATQDFMLLTELAQGPDGLTQMRQRHLDLQNRARSLLLENDLLLLALTTEVDLFRLFAETELSNTVVSLDNILDRIKILMMIVAGTSLIFVVLIDRLYLTPQITRRLEGLADRMRSIAAGQFGGPISHEGEDEITIMAQDLAVFRNAMIQLSTKTAELQESEERLQTLLASSPLPLCIVTMDKQDVVFTNERFEAMFSNLLPKTERNDQANPNLMNLDQAFFVNTPDQDDVWTTLQTKNTLDDTEYQVFINKTDKVWVLLSAIRLDYGTQDCAVMIFNDITDRKNFELQLTKARDAAEQAARAKSEFMANMSHEIRTPIAAITGYTQLALADTLNDQQRMFLSRIDGAANTLKRVIDDILDFSRIEAGKMTIEYTSFNLASVLDNLSTICGILAEKKSLKLSITTDPNVPFALKGDSMRLGQILLNLVNNAIKFTDSGEVRVRVSSRQVDQTDSRVILRVDVADTGIGMNNDQINKLFRPFSQADSSTTRRFGGSGLGLTISKQLVEMMGGSIGVDSAPGAGTVFFFTVMLERDQTLPDLSEHTPAFANMRIWVIDGDETSQGLIDHMLKDLGVEAWFMATAHDAQDRLKQIDHATYPEVIFLDARIPELDLTSLSDMIEQHNDLPKPIFVMIAESDTEDLAPTIKSLGIKQVLAKPIDVSTLFDTLMYVRRESLNSLGPEATDIQPAQAAQKQILVEDSHLTGLRILLAEDNEFLQEMGLMMLKKLGFDAELAKNGQEAVAKILAEPNRFDAVLMDVQMPEMDGLDATVEIRKVINAQQLPIIALTAHAMEQERQRCLDVGMNAHLTKPLSASLLTQTLREQLGRDVHTVEPITS